jgi:tetratricopeptide (TPR) repeat protein
MRCPNGKLYATRGELLTRLGRRREAIEAYSWAANLDGPAGVHWYLGHLLRAEGELERAIQSFETYRASRQDKEGAAAVQELIDGLRREQLVH